MVSFGGSVYDKTTEEIFFLRENILKHNKRYKLLIFLITMMRLAGYGANGTFIFDEKVCRQRGIIGLFPSGKIIGIINDSNEGHLSIPKLVLGVSQGQTLKYFKLAPPQCRLYPVIWKMDTTQPVNENELGEEYRGIWSFASNLPLEGALERITSRGIDEDVVIYLSSISFSELIESYFDERMMQEVERLGMQHNRSGVLNLTRK